jgi:hypothetical protein
MPHPPRLFAGDIELGKRDDDHRPGKRSPLGMLWSQRRLALGPHRRTMKRVALGALALIALYYFFKNMPTDLENPGIRPQYDHATQQVGVGLNYPPSTHPGSKPKQSQEDITEASPHYFNGPIKFYHLASTLHAVSRTKGSELVNRNVVSLSQTSLMYSAKSS